jgi:hypothetical protein
MSLDDLAFEASDLCETTRAYLEQELPGKSKLRPFLSPICQIHMGIVMWLYVRSQASAGPVWFDNRPHWERMLRMFGLGEGDSEERRVLHHIHHVIWGPLVVKACEASERSTVS